MAPEVYNKMYGLPCDLWSCGVIMYFLVCGELPFDGRSENAIKRAVIRGKYTFGCSAWNLTQSAVDVVGRLLDRDPKRRCGAEEALGFPWFQKNVPLPKGVTIRPCLIDNLCKFRSLNKLTRASLHVIASMLADRDTQYSREVFQMLDVDGDGLLCMSELRKCLQPRTGLRRMRRSQTDVLKVILHDTDQQHVYERDFSYTEFLAATFDREACIVDSVCWAAFNCFDKGSTGNISMADVASGSLLGSLSMDELDQHFKELDIDQDGVIDFDEFLQMLGSCV